MSACAIAVRNSAIESAARSRAQADLQCSDFQLQDVGGGAWRADGCGAHAEYVCTVEGQGWMMRGVCIREGSVERAERGAPARQEPPRLVREWLEDARPRLEACNVTDRPVAVRVAYREQHFELLDLVHSAAVTRCMARVAASIIPLGVDSLPGGDFTFRLTVQTRDPTPPPTAPAPTAIRDRDVVEASVRAIVDRLAPQIIACAGAGPVRVQIDYAADGRLTASLRDRLRATMEEGCVRALVAAEHVDSPGEAGSVLHLAR